MGESTTNRNRPMTTVEEFKEFLLLCLLLAALFFIALVYAVIGRGRVTDMFRFLMG